MRKHLAVVGVVTMSMAAAAPASARLADTVPAGTRPAVTFAPGMSDAAQSGYKPHPAARVALPPDLRGEAARAAAEPAASGGTAAAAQPAAAATAPTAVTPADDGLEWSSVGLGAGGGILLAAMAAGGVVLVTRRGPRVRASR
jgi:hypothetical protein